MNAQPDEPTKFLRIYLRDHFAGSTIGKQRSARLAKAESESSDAAALAKVAADIAEDRDALARVMSTLGIVPSRLKAGIGSIAERLGLLKLNGRLVHRSPLSTIVELEALRMAVRGKRALWETLQVAAPQVPVDLDKLIARADDQAEVLKAIHTDWLARAFSPRER